MPVHNAYTDKPMVPYVHTTVAMDDVVLWILTQPYQTEVKRVGYVIFRNESANGGAGINNNYVGMQADGNRWSDEWTRYITGVVDLRENRGVERLFCALDTWQHCVEFLLDEVHRRGVYIGGKTDYITHVEVDTQDDLVTAYYREWVTGNASAVVPDNVRESFLSMYLQAEEKFPSPVVNGNPPAAPPQE